MRGLKTCWSKGSKCSYQNNEQRNHKKKKKKTPKKKSKARKATSVMDNVKDNNCLQMCKAKCGMNEEVLTKVVKDINIRKFASPVKTDTI